MPRIRVHRAHRDSLYFVQRGFRGRPHPRESQIEAFANRTGKSKDDLVRDALLGYLEDRQDAMIAAERLKHVGGRISLEELGRKYGFAGAS